MTNTASVCLIPARAGSKRIPNKNIRLFHGQPLITWSIQTAIDSGLFDAIYVSTDSHEIADIASAHGATIPFMRPSKLADDYTIDLDVKNHFLDWAKDKDLKLDELCYLYPTAPFITVKTLKGCRDLLRNEGASKAYTITTYPYPVMRALIEGKDKDLSFVWSQYENVRSQDMPEYFHDAGQCYFYDLGKRGNNSKTVGYRISRHESQDIDTEEDFLVAEELFALKLTRSYSEKKHSCQQILKGAS